MPHTRPSRSSKSRSKILASAESIFLAKGFLSTNMDEVAEKADVSKQTVYAHFKSKEQLFISTIEAMTGPVNAQMKPADTKRSVDAFLYESAMLDLRLVLTPKLMQLRRMVIGEAGRFPELGRALYENGPAVSIHWLADALKAYHRQGQLRVPNALQAAKFYNWLVMGAFTNEAMFLGDDALPDQAKLKPHAKECVRIFLAAYGQAAR